MRRLHAAQHSGGGDDEIDFTEFRRNVSGRPINDSLRSQEKKAEEEKMEVSLERMINDHGFAPLNEPTLKSFIELQTESNRRIDSLGIETAGTFPGAVLMELFYTFYITLMFCRLQILFMTSIITSLTHI